MRKLEVQPAPRISRSTGELEVGATGVGLCVRVMMDEDGGDLCLS